MNETVSLEVLEKHVLTDGTGTAIFLFEPDEVLVTNEDGTFFLQTEKPVIDLLAIIDQCEVPFCEESALAMVTLLLEKREAGELAEYA